MLIPCYDWAMSVLYHASQNKNLTAAEPKRTLSKDIYIGDFVFATTDKFLATMYLATKGYATLLGSQDEQPNIVICADANDYLTHDQGGAIYELPSDSFTESPQKELSDYELVSLIPVKPLNKTVYDKSLDAMQDSGIVVRFVDKQTFDNLIGHPKQAELIQQLPTYRN